MFYVYMLRCSDGSYYVGHTDNLEARLAAHESGTFAGYTFARRPVRLVWVEGFYMRDEAFARERQVKGWSRAKKEALIRQDWGALPELAEGKNRAQRRKLPDAPSQSTPPSA